MRPVCHNSSSAANQCGSRNASLELLRLVLIWMVVMFHFGIRALPGNDEQAVRLLLPSVHVAVPVFVLISGWFSISFSRRKLASLYSRVWFYSIFGALLAIGLDALGLTPAGDRLRVGGHDAAALVLPLLWEHWWFFSSYIVLFLLAPFINRLLASLDLRGRWLWLGAMGFVCCVMGSVGRVEWLQTGHNGLNFIFIYSVGHCMARDHWLAGWSARRLFAAWAGSVVAVAAVLWLAGEPESYGVAKMWRLAWHYNSPVMIGQAVLFMALWTRLRLPGGGRMARWVNGAAASVFAVYLLHEHMLLQPWVHEPVKRLWQAGTLPLAGVWGVCAVYAVVVIAVCVAVDKAMQPAVRRLSLLFYRLMGAASSRLPLRQGA